MIPFEVVVLGVFFAFQWTVMASFGLGLAAAKVLK